jgi:hypothetical protein
LNRIATVLSLLALYLFHGKNVHGTVVAIFFAVFSLWNSNEISRIAYGSRKFRGCPDLDSVPQWLQWTSFCLFLFTCLLAICGLYYHLT